MRRVDAPLELGPPHLPPDVAAPHHLPLRPQRRHLRRPPRHRHVHDRRCVCPAFTAAHPPACSPPRVCVCVCVSAVGAASIFLMGSAHDAAYYIEAMRETGWMLPLAKMAVAGPLAYHFMTGVRHIVRVCTPPSPAACPLTRCIRTAVGQPHCARPQELRDDVLRHHRPVRRHHPRCCRHRDRRQGELDEAKRSSLEGQADWRVKLTEEYRSCVASCGVLCLRSENHKDVVGTCASLCVWVGSLFAALGALALLARAGELDA